MKIQILLLKKKSMLHLELQLLIYQSFYDLWFFIQNKGVQFMLDAVCKYLPSPLDKDDIKGTDPKTDAEIIRKPDVKEPFAALAFKIATDPFVGRLAFFRAYSGRLDAGSYVLNTRSGNKERISRIYQMHANKQNPVEFIEAGDIGAAVGFKDIKTGRYSF